MTQPLESSDLSRRTFVAASAGLVATSLTGSLASRAWARFPAVHAAGGDRIKVGLIGCGGRGSGAAAQALAADPGVILHAMGDAFPERIESALKGLNEAQKESVAGGGADHSSRIDVPSERRFTGLDAHLKVINECDVVLLASPPHFRPMELRAAVNAGKHVFCEKPTGIDSTGVRSVLESGTIASSKNLSVVVGFCWRYATRECDVYNKIHNGAIGDVMAVYTNYNAGGFPAPRPRKDGESDMHWQVRNWHYFKWLSGDHIVEQAVHSINKIAWAFGDVAPISATAVGGRQLRENVPENGDIYDHFNVTYDYPNGAKAFHMCRHWPNCSTENADYIMGTKGRAFVNGWIDKQEIVGESTWQSTVARNDMYQAEHDALFRSIREGKPINDVPMGANATLLAVMGRLAAYTGQTVTWEQALNSKERLGPDTYAFDAPAPVPSIAMPGKYKLI